MSPLEFVNLLGNWIEGEGPVYERLARSIRRALSNGEVRAGSRLPAERTLARVLSVSRTTVVSAYASLREEGWLVSRQGSGTRAREAPATGTPLLDEASGSFRRHPVYRGLIEGSGATIGFLAAHLPAAGITPEVLTFDRRAVEKLLAGPGYVPLGLPALRQAIAAHLSRSGLPTASEQVLVTSGSQQAIQLVVALCLARGDAVVVENPTYLGAIDILASHGARLLPVPVGAAGARVDLLRELAKRSGPRLLYLMPTFQNPTGTLMPERERRAVARVSQELSVPILEDNTLADLSLGAETPPPIAAFAPRAPILTVGSLSKLFWGGLRVGWIRTSEEILAKIARLKIIADLGGSILSQLAAIKLLGKADQIVQMRRRQIRERFDRLTDLLSRHLPGWTWTLPAGGLSLWVKLPRGDASEFAQIALRHGVSVLPGPLASPDGSFEDHLRLPFVLEKEAMEEGVARLARAWIAYTAAEDSLARKSLHVLV